jgi:hypothetical protein
VKIRLAPFTHSLPLKPFYANDWLHLLSTLPLAASCFTACAKLLESSVGHQECPVS